jgi:AmiR/NasT family two-component response regulator
VSDVERIEDATGTLIEQAKGILAERRHISLTEAFTLMRSYARNHNRLLSQVARAITNQTRHHRPGDTSNPTTG